ncbi:uncharacterized protein LOC143530323 [Bidens hawaiensis]|uniref:uncharacterized protein LOC143530323 n=1 Tax=Bidens hawaiensis TaxID=980011 RepID=UPI00404B22BA
MQPDHKRKKKRGRSSKLLFKSCFRSHERPLLNNKSDQTTFNNININQEDFVTDERSTTNGRGVSRLLKAVLFDKAKKTRSNSKSSIASDTSDAFLSFEKTGKQSEDVNACANEPMDVDDASSRSNLLSSSSRASSTSYSSSSSSSKNSNSRWPSEQKTSSPIDILDPVSSNLSSLNKSNLVNNSSCCYNKYGSEERYNITGCQPRHLLCCTNNSRSCSEQKSLSQTDSVSLPLAKSTSLPKPSSPYNKQLSQTEPQDSADSRSLISIKSASNNLNNIRWCLFLLLSLIVLVIYGRIYSILCTSMWFYLVPLGCVKRVDSVTDTAELMDTESEQYKKRVIMAGLLDRTRNSIR